MTFLKPSKVEVKIIKPKVFLACPSYGSIAPESVISIMRASLGGCDVNFRIRKPGSLLPLEFNCLWCEALNMRKELGLTHFAMIHSDVEAPPGWLDVLVKEQQRVKADVLSVVIAIKDSLGAVSTAIMDPTTKEIERLNLKQTRSYSPTFSIKNTHRPNDYLCINTGLWVCDFTKSWVEKVWFQFSDWIIKQEDGKFAPRVIPEDWNFSAMCGNLKLRVFATHIVNTNHYGRASFPNDHIWGTESQKIEENHRENPSPVGV